MWLACYSYSRSLLLFKVRCKTHYNFHIAADIRATRLNPAMFQNFDEESFLGKLKRIGIRCHGATCVQRMFMRYLLCLAMFVRDFTKKANHMDWVKTPPELKFSHEKIVDGVLVLYFPHKLCQSLQIPWICMGCLPQWSQRLYIWSYFGWNGQHAQFGLQRV